jgi:hypothetical protein
MLSFRYFFRLALLSLLPFVGIPSQNPQYSAELKMRNIEKNRWPENRAISFSAPELVALGITEVAQTAPGAVYRPSLQLHAGGGVATAVIDFDKLQKLSGSGSDWLLSKLLSGQHDVSVAVEIRSGAGLMTIHPTEVTIGGVAASGTTLDFLVDHVVRSYYPQAVINRPFKLANNIERVDVTPSSAVVYRK